MTGNIIGYSGFITSILLAVLFVIGLGLSKMHSFKPGIYFFLLLIVHQIFAMVSPPLIRNYIERLVAENTKPLLGMTIGEFVALLSLMLKVILFAAFLFLITGLRNLLKTYHPVSK